MAIDNFNDPECSDTTPTVPAAKATGAIIGGVVGGVVAILIAVLALVVVVCLLRNCRKKASYNLEVDKDVVYSKLVIIIY